MRSTSCVKDVVPCPVIYIAGPIRNPSHWEIEQNIRRAEAMWLDLCKLGAAPICPHTMGRAMLFGVLPDDTWLNLDYSYIDQSHAIYLLDGWEKSVGSCGEREYAEATQTPIFTSAEWRSGAMHAWVRAWKEQAVLRSAIDQQFGVDLHGVVIDGP